jgi:hypothetical protein
MGAVAPDSEEGRGAAENFTFDHRDPELASAGLKFESRSTEAYGRE